MPQITEMQCPCPERRPYAAECPWHKERRITSYNVCYTKLLRVTLVALFFTKLHIHSYTIVIAVVILTSILFSLGGFINAVFARKFDDISIIPRNNFV